MPRSRLPTIGLLAVLAASPVAAGLPPLLGTSEDQLAGTLRGLLLDHLPDPLYEAQPGWGRTKDVRRLRIRRGRAEWKTVAENDGLWKKFRAVALSPRDNLVLDLREVSSPTPGVLRFTVFVAADARFEGWQEQWEAGLKLYGVSVRARARVKVTLGCDAAVRAELKDGLPDLVAELRVTRAEVAYDNLVVEHVAGLGGEAAKLLGEAGRDLMRQWKPSLERDVLAKANRAVEKAGQRKEVRVGLSRLIKAKK
jgi:hypothetical protein